MSIIQRRLPQYCAANENAKPVVTEVKKLDPFHECDRKGYHEFSANIAKEFGEREAILLQYLAYRICDKPYAKDGKKWTFGSLSKLAKRYPYIKRSTLGSILNRMESEGLIEIGCFNKWKHDKTQWFHVPQKYLDACEKQKMIKFNSHVAAKYGIPAAVIYHNLVYWIGEQCKKNEGKLPVQSMSPAGLNELLPFFSLNTIKRALKKLVADSVILKTSPEKPSYTLPADHPIMNKFLGEDDL